MTQLFANAARGVVTAVVGSTDTTISITSGGSAFPVANTDTAAIGPGLDWFKAVLQDVTGIEIVYVRTHATGSTTFSNVIRGQEGTTARAFASNAVFGVRVTAGDMGAVTKNYVFSQYTASTTFTVPANTYVIRPYAFGAGGTGTGAQYGGGGGCAYGDVAVTPGEVITLDITAGVAKVTSQSIDRVIANPASGVTAGTASKHASVANGGAYSGGLGGSSASKGGASSGSPLGIGVNGGGLGGSGWGGGGSSWGGGGVGGPSESIRSGPGFVLPSTDPLLAGLNSPGVPGQPSGAACNGHSGGPGAGGNHGVDGQSGDGGFGAGGGGGASATSKGGKGGFGGGGGCTYGDGATYFAGAGGYGGGGGCGTTTAAAGGSAVIRIYY